jgi:hypothetical protein
MAFRTSRWSLADEAVALWDFQSVLSSTWEAMAFLALEVLAD